MDQEANQEGGQEAGQVADQVEDQEVRAVAKVHAVLAIRVVLRKEEHLNVSYKYMLVDYFSIKGNSSVSSSN